MKLFQAIYEKKKKKLKKRVSGAKTSPKKIVLLLRLR